jgi:hypothetical protein
MALLQTTDTLVDEVRSLTNELNQDALQTERDILPALNRAQEHMMSILTKHYPEPYLVPHEFDVTTNASYTIPEDAWSDTVTKIEMLAPNRSNRYEVERASYRDATKFRSDAKPNTPYYYIIRGREVEFIPAPSGSYDAIMWYVRAPERLVLQQGRITQVTGTDTFYVDQHGSGLDTNLDELASWVNIIDGQTGEIKATCQIKALNGTQQIVIKSSINSNILDAYGKILNRTPTTDLTTVVDNNGNPAVHPNDYVCSIQGTCVPYFFQPARNFIISHAAADCGRSIGVPSDSMYREREKFEKEIKSTWLGREASLRIKNNSPHWSLRRYVSRFRR